MDDTHIKKMDWTPSLADAFWKAAQDAVAGDYAVLRDTFGMTADTEDRPSFLRWFNAMACAALDYEVAAIRARGGTIAVLHENEIPEYDVYDITVDMDGRRIGASGALARNIRDAIRSGPEV